MIIATILAVMVGILAGLSADALMRGSHSRSATVVAWAVAGALVSVLARYLAGPRDILTVVLTAAVGGMAFAFACRARLSSMLEHQAR